MKWQLHVALGLLVCTVACGTPGAPRPPSLELPRPAGDLAATRVGDRVTLTWTAPRETTDGTNIRHPGPTRICRGVDQVAMVTCTPVGEVPAVAAIGTSEQPVGAGYTDSLPVALEREHPTGFATYAVEAFNDRGKTAGLSNQVEVPLAPTLPPPTNLKAQVTPEGIVITGYREESVAPPPGVNFEVHVYRREDAGEARTDLGVALQFQSGKNLYHSFSDRTIEWGKTYAYSLAVITEAKLPGGTTAVVPGEPSPEVQVVARDVFPPATPVGLQAVASGVGQPPFVDLTWAPNTDSDLAGYNVYRHEAGQPPLKINAQLATAPAYRDGNVQRGHKYFYAATAVDLRGNESPRSEEASELVP